MESPVPPKGEPAASPPPPLTAQETRTTDAPLDSTSRCGVESATPRVAPSPDRRAPIDSDAGSDAALTNATPAASNKTETEVTSKIIVPLVPPPGASVVIVQENGQTFKVEPPNSVLPPPMLDSAVVDRMKKEPSPPTVGTRRLIFIPASSSSSASPTPATLPSSASSGSSGDVTAVNVKHGTSNGNGGGDGACVGRPKPCTGGPHAAGAVLPVPPKPCHGLPIGSSSSNGTTMFASGMEVLVRLKDNLFYYGTIKKVDEYHKRCRVTFEDEVDDIWASFKDIKIGPSLTPSPGEGSHHCSICGREGRLGLGDDLIVCSSCDLAFHQYCHEPAVLSQTLKMTPAWKCHKCSSSLSQNQIARPYTQAPTPLTPGTLKPPPFKSPSLNDPLHRSSPGCQPNFPPGTTVLSFPSDDYGGSNDVVEIEEVDDLPSFPVRSSSPGPTQPDLPLKKQPVYSSGKEREPKTSFSYNMSALKWDMRHQENEQKMYCYCGKFGDWYDKMLQCWRCGQWFHEGCVQVLQYPLLYGDRFYLFVCSVCNHGLEYVRRLDLNWCTIVHLVLFNLSQSRMRKYYDLDSEIMPFLNEHWDCLQLHHLSDTQPRERYDHVKSELYLHKDVFACGREIKKRTTLWGLRTRIPPLVTPYWIPAPETKIDDESLARLASESGALDKSDTTEADDPTLPPAGAVVSFHAESFDPALISHVIDADDDDRDESDGNASGDDAGAEIKRERKRKRPMGCQAVGKGVLAQFFCPKRRRRIMKKDNVAGVVAGPFSGSKVDPMMKQQKKIKKEKSRLLMKGSAAREAADAPGIGRVSEVGMMPVMAMPTGVLAPGVNAKPNSRLSNDCSAQPSNPIVQHLQQQAATQQSIYIPAMTAFNPASSPASHVLVSPFNSQNSRPSAPNPHSFLIPVSALQQIAAQQQQQQSASLAKSGVSPPTEKTASSDEKVGVGATASGAAPVAKPFFIMSPSGQIFAVTGQVQGQPPSVTPAPTYQYAPSPVYSQPPPLSPQYPNPPETALSSDSPRPPSLVADPPKQEAAPLPTKPAFPAPSLPPQESSRGVQSSSSSTAPQTPCDTPTTSSSSSERESPFTEIAPIPVPIKMKKSKHKKQKSKKKKEKYRLHSGHLEVVWKKQRQSHDRPCRDDGCTGFSSKSRKRRHAECRHERRCGDGVRLLGNDAARLVGAVDSKAASSERKDEAGTVESTRNSPNKRGISPESRLDDDVLLDDGASDVLHIDEDSLEAPVLTPDAPSPAFRAPIPTDVPSSFRSSTSGAGKTDPAAASTSRVLRSKTDVEDGTAARPSLAAWFMIGGGEDDDSAEDSAPTSSSSSRRRTTPTSRLLAGFSSSSSSSNDAPPLRPSFAEPVRCRPLTRPKPAPSKQRRISFDAARPVFPGAAKMEPAALKKSVATFLGAEARPDDERRKYRVYGRRTTPEGKVHYLIQWVDGKTEKKTGKR